MESRQGMANRYSFWSSWWAGMKYPTLHICTKFSNPVSFWKSRAQHVSAKIITKCMLQLYIQRCLFSTQREAQTVILITYESVSISWSLFVSECLLISYKVQTLTKGFEKESFTRTMTIGRWGSLAANLCSTGCKADKKISHDIMPMTYHIHFMWWAQNTTYKEKLSL